MTDHPQVMDGPPCPVCERPGVRVRDEDGRWVWECDNRDCSGDETEETDDE
jgi:hypothetical protein